MTIAQIVQHMQPGGIESLALTLMEKNPNSIVISLEGPANKAFRSWPKLKDVKDQLYFLDKPAGFSYSTVRKINHLFSAKNITAVHTHHIGPYVYGGIAALINRIPNHVHTEHDGWHLQNVKHCIIQKSLNAFVRPTLVADAHHVADVIKTRTGAESKVIYNGIDTAKFLPCNNFIEKSTLRQRWGLPRFSYLIGSAGRLESVKGHEYLIRAMARVPKDISLVIAGSGSLESSLKKLAKTLNVSHRVFFLGHIDHTEYFYPMLDGFCLPSLNEGFPLAPLEAQSCNVSTIVTDVGGAKETLCLKSGISVQPKDINALANAIIQQRETKIETQPRAHVSQNFSIDSMVSAYHQLLLA